MHINDNEDGDDDIDSIGNIIQKIYNTCKKIRNVTLHVQKIL